MGMQGGVAWVGAWLREDWWVWDAAGWLPCWPLAPLLTPAAAPPPSRPSPCPPAPLPARRVQLNTDLWQLVGAWATATPQLVKVLVRADEGAGAAICAAVAVPPSTTGARALLEHLAVSVCHPQGIPAGRSQQCKQIVSQPTMHRPPHKRLLCRACHPAPACLHAGRIERDVTAVAVTPVRSRPSGSKRPRASRRRSSSEAPDDEEEDEEAEAEEAEEEAARQQARRRLQPSPYRQQQQQQEQQQQQSQEHYRRQHSNYPQQQLFAQPQYQHPQYQQQQQHQHQRQQYQQLQQYQQYQHPLLVFAEGSLEEEAMCDSAAGPQRRLSPSLQTPPVRRMLGAQLTARGGGGGGGAALPSNSPQAGGEWGWLSGRAAGQRCAAAFCAGLGWPLAPTHIPACSLVCLQTRAAPLSQPTLRQQQRRQQQQRPRWQPRGGSSRGRRGQATCAFLPPACCTLLARQAALRHMQRAAAAVPPPLPEQQQQQQQRLLPAPCAAASWQRRARAPLAQLVQTTPLPSAGAPLVCAARPPLSSPRQTAYSSATAACLPAARRSQVGGRM